MPLLKIGHRGAKAHVPENTLASFKKAIALGADAIELDVHTCASGELVVIHDFTVDRTTNGSGEVHNLTLKEIRQLTIEGQYKIPTLTEVIDQINGKCIINIEIKGEGTAKPVAVLLKMYVEEQGYSYNHFIVSSFLYAELKEIYAINKNIHLGVLTEDNFNEALRWAKELSAKALHPHFSLLNQSNVLEVQEAGYKIYTWTVNEPEDIARIKSYNVDGIISDYPERI